MKGWDSRHTQNIHRNNYAVYDLMSGFNKAANKIALGFLNCSCYNRLAMYARLSNAITVNLLQKD